MQILSVFTLCFQFCTLDTFTVFCNVFINKLGHPNLCQSTWHNPTLKGCKTHNIYWMAETIKIPFQCQIYTNGGRAFTKVECKCNTMQHL